jgi:hypothetical protein
MRSFDEVLDKSNRGRAIRWPFRLLATVIVLGALFAALGSAYSAFRRKDPSAAVLAVTFAPIAAVVGRLGGYAVWKGYVIRNPFWPFASGSVASFWILVALVVVSYV